MAAALRSDQPSSPQPVLAGSGGSGGVGWSGRPASLPSLTGLRWLAAVMVFGLHLAIVEYFSGPAAGVVSAFFSAGATGVSFFFVLSGFVLAWSARPGDRPGRFWRRRVARVYPLHLVTAVLALLLAVVSLASGEGLSFTTAVLNILLLHAWNPDVHFSQSLNPVSWSLACEAFFYAVFPLLMPAVRRLGVRGLHLVGLGCLVAVVVVPLAVGDPAIHFVPVARLPEFVLGLVTAQLVLDGRWRGPGPAASLVVLLVGYVGTAWAPAPLRYAACTALGFTLLIPAVAGTDLRGRSTWLARPLLVRLGELSFAFYMIHVLVMRTGESLFTSHPRLALLPALGVSAAVFVITLALSWALHEWVEKPARALLVRPARADGRPASPAA